MGDFVHMVNLIHLIINERNPGIQQPLASVTLEGSPKPLEVQSLIRNG